jgi:hypothetical protein
MTAGGVVLRPGVSRSPRPTTGEAPVPHGHKKGENHGPPVF